MKVIAFANLQFVKKILRMQKQVFLEKMGQHIKELRAKKNLSQTDIAHACGKDPQSLERVENGKTNPSIYYLFEISKALKIPLRELIDF